MNLPVERDELDSNAFGKAKVYPGWMVRPPSTGKQTPVMCSFSNRNCTAWAMCCGDARTSGDESECASGNGSIMRLAPVPIRYAGVFPVAIGELRRLAAESSLPTHASPQCLSACRYLALVLCGLVHGLDRDEVLAADWPPLEQLRQLKPLHPEVEAVATGSFRHSQLPAIAGSGYVVKSLEAALWAFHDARDFRGAVLKAVNLGDDADTTGAVCGQLAGAYWGERGIPPEWLAGLARREMIDNALAGLFH